MPTVVSSIYHTTKLSVFFTNLQLVLMPRNSTRCQVKLYAATCLVWSIWHLLLNRPTSCLPCQL